MKSYLLKNGEIVTAGVVLARDVLIENGRIAAILESGEEVDGSPEEIDCIGKLILPGLIDAHVHMREPGHSYKEDWITGSSGAAAGGVTTVLDMPNNDPPIVTVKTLEEKRCLIAGRSFVNYGLYMGYDGGNIKEINDARNIAGIKVYMANSTGDMGVGNFEELFENTGKLIVVHAEDGDIIQKNSEEYLAEFEGREIAPRVHSKIRNRDAAASAVQYICDLAKKYKVRTHIAHISTEKELDIIARCRDYVTCEVSPHHLILNEDDYEALGNFVKMNPPARSRNDVFALWLGLKSGAIDIVATDHAPHTVEEKEEDYLSAPSGVPELDTFLPIMLNSVNQEGLKIEDVVDLCCEGPAEIFGIEGKGRIEEGFDADLVVVDMDLEKKVSDEYLFTKCGWSPYNDSLLQGWPVMTFVNGVKVFENLKGFGPGKICGEAVGEEVDFG